MIIFNFFLTTMSYTKDQLILMLKSERDKERSKGHFVSVREFNKQIVSIKNGTDKTFQTAV